MGVRSGDHLELPFLKISTKLNLRRSNGPLIWTMGRFISSLTVRIIYSKNSLFFGELCFSRHNNQKTKILSLIQFFFVLSKHKQKNLKKMRVDLCFKKKVIRKYKKA